MSVWPSKYVTIFDFCVSLVVQWSVGAEGRAPSAQHALVPQRRASTAVVCKGKIGTVVPMCPPTLSITSTTTAIPHGKDGRVWQYSLAGSS